MSQCSLANCCEEALGGRRFIPSCVPVCNLIPPSRIDFLIPPSVFYLTHSVVMCIDAFGAYDRTRSVLWQSLGRLCSVMKLLAFLVTFVVIGCAFTSAHGAVPSMPLWNQQRAQKLLPLAWATYCPLPGLKDWTCWWCKANGTPAVKVHGTFHDVTAKYALFMSEPSFWNSNRRDLSSASPLSDLLCLLSTQVSSDMSER